MTAPLLHTACHAWHVAHGARMVDFAGWHMPVQYSAIVAEHLAVRRAAGLFDIGHMGRLRIAGPEALLLLESLLTCQVASLQAGQARYALVTNEQGGILDDVLVYRLPDHYLLVVNASNRQKIMKWIDAHRRGVDVTLIDETQTTCMFALQGPRAASLLQPLAGMDLAALKYYFAAQTTLEGQPVIVSRTGYTGEDGFEVIAGAARGADLWQSLLRAGAEFELAPCGLGARDTLRLEAGMPLYGHELDESIDPFTAGLGFAVKREEGFVGRAALELLRGQADRRQRVGLVLAGKRIAREQAPVCCNARVVGRVTSGTWSPTLERSIAMAYVDTFASNPGTTLLVDIRGQPEPAQVVKLPFYKRPKA